jgi:hypothetical protein
MNLKLSEHGVLLTLRRWAASLSDCNCWASFEQNDVMSSQAQCWVSSAPAGCT